LYFIKICGILYSVSKNLQNQILFLQEEFMKKLLALAIITVMIFALAIPAMAYNITITAPKGTPVIDGVKDDAYGDFINFDYIDNSDGAGGKIAVAWDDDNIYCFVEVYDTTPFHDNATDWQTDNVEFFFDWNNHKAEGDITNHDEPFWQARIHSAPGENEYGITAHANNVWYPDNGFDAIKFVIVPIGAADLSGGYIIEAAFPRSAVEGGMTLTEGKVLGFDATISDAHDDDERYSTGFFFNHSDYDMPSDMWTNPSALKALLVLGAAKAPAAVVDDPPAPADDVVVDVPAVQPPAAKTGDSMIMLIVLVTALAGAFVITKRIKN